MSPDHENNNNFVPCHQLEAKFSLSINFIFHLFIKKSFIKLVILYLEILFNITKFCHKTKFYRNKI